MQCWDLSSIIFGIALVVLDFLDCCMCCKVCVLVERGDIYIGVAERREIRAEGGLFRLNVLRAWRCILQVLFDSELYKTDYSIDFFFQSMYREVCTGSEAHDDDVLHN